MPVRNAATCKYILDNGGAAKSALDATVTMMTAVGANILEGTVADTPAGEEWVKKVKQQYEKTIDKATKLADEFKDLCMSQPVA